MATEKSAYTLLRSLVNGMEIGSELSRYRMQSAFRKEFGDGRNILSVDSYKSYFLKLGYLIPTAVKGFYTIGKHIPEDLKATEMRKQYNLATGYVDKQLAKFKEEVSNAEYLEIKYRSVEFVVMFNMSYIQGVITNLLVDYAQSITDIQAAPEALKMLEKIIHYAKIADFMKHKNTTISVMNSSVDRFSEIHGFNPTMIEAFKLTLRNKWTQVIKTIEKLK